MKKSIIIIGSVILLTTGIVWCVRKKEKPIQPQKPKTPEMLTRDLVIKILQKGEWKNERDFLSILTKQYIKESPSLDWIDYLPVCQEDLLEKLNELGLLEQYEKDLEIKYKKVGK